MTLCGCGCGQDAGVYAHSCKYGRKGEPKRFIYGHHARFKPRSWPDRVCECGCGSKTPPAKKTNRAKGRIRGKPLRFIPGHQGRSSPQKGKNHHNWNGGRQSVGAGYISVLMPEHPRATKRGYVYEHIVVAERSLGKHLPEGAVVHHVNRDPSDNRPENLVICQDTAYHMHLHYRMRQRAKRRET